MRDHVKILGILNIVLGSLTAFVGVGLMLLLGGIAGVIASTDHDGREAAPWLGLIGFFICAVLVLVSIPAIIGGWGLLKFKPWSRNLMIVVSLLSLTHVPIGTAIGVYGLWVLFNEEARQLLETGGALPAPVYPMPGQPFHQAL